MAATSAAMTSFGFRPYGFLLPAMRFTPNSVMAALVAAIHVVPLDSAMWGRDL
jgi:hypothetical protein